MSRLLAVLAVVMTTFSLIAGNTYASVHQNHVLSDGGDGPTEGTRCEHFLEGLAIPSHDGGYLVCVGVGGGEYVWIWFPASCSSFCPRRW